MAINGVLDWGARWEVKYLENTAMGSVGHLSSGL